MPRLSENKLSWHLARLVSALHQAIIAHSAPNSFGLVELQRLYQAPTPAQGGLLMLRHRAQIEHDLSVLAGQPYVLEYQTTRDGRRIRVTSAFGRVELATQPISWAGPWEVGQSKRIRKGAYHGWHVEVWLTPASDARIVNGRRIDSWIYSIDLDRPDGRDGRGQRIIETTSIEGDLAVVRVAVEACVGALVERQKL